MSLTHLTCVRDGPKPQKDRNRYHTMARRNPNLPYTRLPNVCEVLFFLLRSPREGFSRMFCFVDNVTKSHVKNVSTALLSVASRGGGGAGRTLQGLKTKTNRKYGGESILCCDGSKLARIFQPPSPLSPPLFSVCRLSIAPRSWPRTAKSCKFNVPQIRPAAAAI